MDFFSSVTPKKNQKNKKKRIESLKSPFFFLSIGDEKKKRLHATHLIIDASYCKTWQMGGYVY